MNLALIITALVIAAQTAPDLGRETHDERDIVVTGKRDDPKAIIAQTRGISLSHDGQLARFETPICPTVVGLPKNHADVVEKRVRQVADEAKLRVDAPGCTPNLTIVIADDGMNFVNQLNRKRPMLFDSLEFHDLDRLLRWHGPSWTWQSVNPKRRDGGPVERISEIQIGDGPPQPVSKGAYIANNVQLSRLSMPVRQDIDLAFVVLSTKAITGLTLRQVADYAAMVGLAAIRTQIAEIQAKPTILTMFEDSANGREAQKQATAFDIAYLTSLYSGEAGYSTDQKTRAMAIQIDRNTGSVSAP